LCHVLLSVPLSFDRRRTVGAEGNASANNGSGRILHHAGDGGLPECRGRQKRQAEDEQRRTECPRARSLGAVGGENWRHFTRSLRGSRRRPSRKKPSTLDGSMPSSA